MREVVGDHSVNEVLTVGREKIQVDAKEPAPAALRPVRDRPRGAPDRAAGREPARPGQAGVQRGQPGDPGEGTADQRGVGRLQPDRARTRAARPSGWCAPPRATRSSASTTPAATSRASSTSTTSTARRPDVTRKRLYLETLNEVLPKTGRKLIIDSSMKGLLPLLNLDPGRSRRPSSEAPPPRRRRRPRPAHALVVGLHDRRDRAGHHHPVRRAGRRSRTPIPAST